ncbi:helix-turn-helix transcriptional regulator [Hymenobacter sp.]|uniref:helix-turn-helix transcriptional regulator n=1 Tax=Hymenobacter sp. TaxID=1898978 RepID=UPI00286CA88E|nr:helix-turn-helix transcriptional regulator [Hymenobacter sp.]
MSYAPDLRQVRARFGLRQAELATWLGVSQSQLARIETGHDPLPAHAQPWLWPWLRALDLPVPPPAPDPDAAAVAVAMTGAMAPRQPGAGPLAARVGECQFQAWRVHRLLAPLQARLGQQRALLAAGPLLGAALPPLPASPASGDPAALRRRWLARRLEAATDGLLPGQPAGPTAEALLRARRAAWLHEAAWLAAYLAASPAKEPPA